MFAKLLTWMVLHARYDTANEIESWSYAINLWGARSRSGSLTCRVPELGYDV